MTASANSRARLFAETQQDGEKRQVRKKANSGWRKKANSFPTRMNTHGTQNTLISQP